MLLSLPIYLDSIGTMLAGITMGPLAGGLAALVGGLINGVLGDIYAIYFSLSGVLMGVLASRMDYPEELWQKAIEQCVPAKFLELNKKAFMLGRNA